MHGPAVEVPVTEDAVRRPFGHYGVGKAAIEELLLQETRSGGLRTSILHPGHISGPGWAIINPAGNLNPDVWTRLATGQQVTLPNFGLETVHHVHADDVAQSFELALHRQGASVGESFHVVSERALTLRGFAEAVAGWFGQQADLRFVPFEEFRQESKPEDADATLDHISRSPSASIDKARRLLGYQPRYTSLQAAAEAVQWLQSHGGLDLGGRTLTPVIRMQQCRLLSARAQAACLPGTQRDEHSTRRRTTTRARRSSTKSTLSTGHPGGRLVIAVDRPVARSSHRRSRVTAHRPSGDAATRASSGQLSMPVRGASPSREPVRQRIRSAPTNWTSPTESPIALLPVSRS